MDPEPSESSVRCGPRAGPTDILAAETANQRLLEFVAEADLQPAALSAGAAGYLLKGSGPAELSGAIAAAVSGAGTVVSPPAARGLTEEAQATSGRTMGERLPEAGLTRREVEILALLCDGDSNREISRRLVLSGKTVKSYLVSAFGKLGVSNRTQAAILAVSMGIGTLPRRDGLAASPLVS